MLTFLLLATYFLEILGFFAITLLVVLRQKLPIYKNFAIFSGFVGLWQLLQFLAQILSNDQELASNFLRASIVTSGIMASSFLVFARVYSERLGRPVIYYALGALTGFATLFSQNLRNIEITFTGIGVPKLDAWYGSVLLYAIFCVFYGVASIFAHYRRTTDHKRRSQDKIILISTFTVGLFVVASSFYTSEFSQSTLAQHIVPVACLGAMTSFLYAMIYRGLFDIHFFVLRAAAYLSTLFTITLLFVLPLIIIMELMFDFRLNAGRFILVALFTVASVYILQYLRIVFDRFTARVFFRNDYDPQDVLDRLSGVLVRSAETEALREGSISILASALRPQDIRFVLATDHGKPHESRLARAMFDKLPEASAIIRDELDYKKHASLVRELSQEGIALAFKLRTTHMDLGFLVLGNKQSGELYTARDKRLLSTAADEIAIALQNALHFEEIERFNATLQGKVEEATRKLRRTNERLRVLDQTKDDFISMASHQLRTPLTSVKGYVSMVLDGDAGRITSLQRKLLNQSFISSQRMVYLISDLLNVSRLRTGKFLIEPTPTNLAKVIEEEVDQLIETVKGRNLELTFHKPEHFPLLMLDETKIRQVLMNFIDNAVYYTPSGGHIDIYLEETPKSIEFRVVDDGIGVPKHEQHHLFTKFYRAHNAKRARPDGTGLGIFMAKKVVIAQGGAVIFKSREGKGSTFGFTFPKHLLMAPDKTSDKGNEKKESEKNATRKP